MKEGKTIKNAFKNSQEGFGNEARMTLYVIVSDREFLGFLAELNPTQCT